MSVRYVEGGDRLRDSLWQWLLANVATHEPRCLCGKEFGAWTTNMHPIQSLEGHLRSLDESQLKEHVVLMEMQR